MVGFSSNDERANSVATHISVTQNLWLCWVIFHREANSEFESPFVLKGWAAVSHGFHQAVAVARFFQKFIHVLFQLRGQMPHGLVRQTPVLLSHMVFRDSLCICPYVRICTQTKICTHAHVHHMHRAPSEHHRAFVLITTLLLLVVWWRFHVYIYTQEGGTLSKIEVFRQ